MAEDGAVDADAREGSREGHRNRQFRVLDRSRVHRRAEKGRMSAFGRNWNFAGRSTEICKLDWRGP